MHKINNSNSLINNSPSIREKIIKTTLKLLEKSRDLKFSIRDIIHMAGVNIAAVNYYFGSKSKLIKEIQKMFSNKIDELNNQINQKNLTSRESIFMWFDELTTYLVDNPGMTYFLQRVSDAEKLKNDQLIDITQKFLIYIESYIEEVLSDNNDKKIKEVALQIISAIILPLIFPFEYIQMLFNYNVYDIKERRDYINGILTKFLS